MTFSNVVIFGNRLSLRNTMMMEEYCFANRVLCSGARRISSGYLVVSSGFILGVWYYLVDVC